MDAKTVKLGVVGMGRGRDVATRGLDLDHLKLTAVCDRNLEKLEDAKRHFGSMGLTDLRYCADFEELLRADIDAVFIATDAIYHVPYVLRALEAGKHVLSEIPAVNSLEEAKQLKAAVLAHPELKYMTAENSCFRSYVNVWKTMREQGSFGDIVYAEAEYFHADDYRTFRKEDFPEDHWRSFIPAIYYLTHDLGTLLYMMDDRVTTVTCMEPEVQYNPYKRGRQTGAALFRTEKGAVIRILICFGAYVGYAHNYRMVGTRGTIQTDYAKGAVWETTSYARLAEIPGSISAPVTIPIPEAAGADHILADKRCMAAFIRSITEDARPPIDVDLGIRISLPGIYAHESAEKGGASVEIPTV